MRTLAILLLLAGTATPALAQRDDSRNEPRSERTERVERADRPSRAERAESRSQARESRREQRAQRVESQRAVTAQQTQSVQTKAVETQATEPSRERVRRERVIERGDGEVSGRSAGGIAPRQREVRTIPDTSPTTVVTRNEGGTVTTQHRSRDGRRWSENHRRWDRNDWRHDRRYDWRRYRSHNRSAFRLGLYIDPFGWGYRRWGIGSYMYPNYYQSSFWINDPWQYRLPPVYGPYRWVRYHDDALLIDIYSGQVVDVIYNFFW
jgi:hypothetical protein